MLLATLLNKLGNEVYFIGNFDSMFQELISQNEPSLNFASLGSKKPNYTVALQFKRTETQFNQVISSFSPNDITLESLFLLTISKDPQKN